MPSSLLKDLQPLSRVARVAPLVEAITVARKRGVTWRQIVMEIGPVVGIDPNTSSAADALRIAHKAAIRQIAKGRMVPESAQVPSAPTSPKPKPAISPSEPLAGEQRPVRAGFTDIPLNK
jgi:hypothetical protein